MKNLLTIDPSVLSSVTGGQQSWAQQAGQWASKAWDSWKGNSGSGSTWSAPQNPQPSLSPIKPGMNGLAIRERLGQVP